MSLALLPSSWTVLLEDIGSGREHSTLDVNFKANVKTEEIQWTETTRRRRYNEEFLDHMNDLGPVQIGLKLHHSEHILRNLTKSHQKQRTPFRTGANLSFYLFTFQDRSAMRKHDENSRSVFNYKKMPWKIFGTRIKNCSSNFSINVTFASPRKSTHAESK
jgi:hypothetical protein